jgi:histidine kinase
MLPSTQKSTFRALVFSIELLDAVINTLQAIADSNTGFRYIKPANFSTTENSFSFTPLDLSEDLSCIAPEETGLLIDTPDTRAAFYRIGIVLYRLFAGSAPFQSENPTDLLYAQVAQDAPPLLQDNIPSALRQVIHKLLQKKPSQRYQSYEGLLEDLKAILENPAALNFTPGQKDAPTEIFFSSRLYGRTKELEQLTDAIARSDNQNGFILIKGESGIGKTALVHQALHLFAKDSTRIASGKFEQLKRESPYSGFSTILSELVRTIIAEGNDYVEHFRSDLLLSCPHESAYLVRLSKDFSSILAAPEKEIAPTMVRPVLETALKAFLKILSKKFRLIIFADDLQWADSASLDLLTFMAGTSSIRCSIVATYRTDEKAPAFQTRLDTLRAQALVQTEIALAKLSPADLQEWIQALTLIATADLDRLSDFMEKRTFGNPFFFRQLIKSLEKQNCLFYQKGKWHIDFSKALLVEIPKNAADLLLLQLHDLPKTEQHLLSAAAVWGGIFEIGNLQLLLPEYTNLEAALHHCERRSLIYPLSTSENPGAKKYKFAHDHLKTIFYQRMPDKEKEQYHFKAGTILKNKQASAFDIADQYNRALSFFQKEEEKNELAHFNKRAGIKAKRSGAWEASLQYLSKAQELLTANAWEVQPDLKLEVTLEQAEAAYLESQYQQAEALCQEIIARQLTIRPLLRTKELLILVFIASGKMREAVDYTIETLSTIGIELPYSAGEEEIGAQFEQIATLINGRSPLELLHLPAISEWEKETAMRLLMHGGSAAYFVAQDVYPLLSLKQVELSLRYGHCAISADAYTTYGLLLSAFAGDIPGGYAFGKLGVAIREKFQAFDFEAKSATMFNGFVQHVCNPVHQTIEPLKRGFVGGMETGDIEYACYCLTFLFIHQAFTPANYYPTIAEQSKWLATMKRLKNIQTIEMALPWHHLLQQLSSTSFDAGIAQQYAQEVDEEKNPIAKAYAYIARLTAAVLFADRQQALDYGEKVIPLLNHIAGIFILPVWEFYYGLALAETNPEHPEIKKFVEDLEERSLHSPENHAHKVLLLKAVLHQHSPTQALAYFDEACRKAETSGIWLEAGFCYERYASYLSSTGQDTLALGALLKSYKFYSDCGADKKVDAIAGMLKKTSGITAFHQLSDYTELSFREMYKTVLEEIALEPLIQKLLTLTLKSSGAERGLLLLKKENFYIAGEVNGRTYQTATIPLQQYPKAPSDFIHNAVLTGDTKRWYKNQEVQYTSDYYFSSSGIQSALVQPLKVEDEIIGALYLETGKSEIFSDNSLHLLNILSYQVAISIRNAMLYDALSQKEQQMTRVLHEKETLLITMDEQKRNHVLNILEAAEEEKQRLSRELHDHTGQQMAALKMMLQNIASPEKDKLIQLQLLTDQISNSLRQTAHNMMPKTLNEYGLASALEGLLNDTFAQSSIQASFDYFGPDKKRLIKVLERTLYRISQELISNVIRHANATEIYLQLTINEKIIRLMVEDNGIGIGQNPGSGIGMLNIKTRIELFDGTFSLENLPQSGTLATIIIPLHETN